jgi:hypothetical protein
VRGQWTADAVCLGHPALPFAALVRHAASIVVLLVQIVIWVEARVVQLGRVEASEDAWGGLATCCK